jgi:hypothetical protein
MFKKSVPTTKKTYCVYVLTSAASPNEAPVVLFCSLHSNLLYVKIGGTNSYHCSLQNLELTLVLENIYFYGADLIYTRSLHKVNKLKAQQVVRVSVQVSETS